MKFSYLFIYLAFIFPCQGFSQGQIDEVPNYHFKGGWIFNGTQFEKGELYSVNGYISFEKPSTIDSILDIRDQYVIPPFGEAHNHNLVGEDHDDFAKRYIEDGIFYVKNPNSLPRSRAKAGRIKMIGTADAVLANGGITATGGHPSGLTQRNIRLGIFKETEGDGGFIWLIDNLENLNAKWGAILSGKPDFIKTYLLYSEEYEIRKDDTTYFNRKGLNPEILGEIVSRAHDTGLRVSTHVETSADFRNAVNANTDEINHMPGFRNLDDVPLDRFRIREDDARNAAMKGITVVTTLVSDRGDADVRQLHIDNLNILKKAHVKTALGSDVYRGNAKMEADYLHSLGVFSNLELLKIWCETTVETIYPGRRIGKLIEGYEANFLILSANPIEDFKNTEKIGLRVKQGVILGRP